MALDVHVVIAPWDQHKQVLRSIREAVFIVEQEVPRELEWDDEDESATHFLAVNTLGQFIGCARLLKSGQIGRMAVLESHRGQGIGNALLEAAVTAGEEAGFERLFLHAQSYAEPFYRQGGFLPYGQKKRPMNLPTDDIFLEPMMKAAAALESRGLNELSRKLRELGQHIVKYLKTLEDDVVKEVTKRVKKK